MCNDTSENKACAQGKIIFIGTGKATGGAQGWGHVFAQHMPVRIFARGINQGSGKITADA